MPLNQLKQYFPLETAKFSVPRCIDDEPTFKSWLPLNLRPRDMIVAGINKRTSRVTYKDGIDMPISVSRTCVNDDTLWMDAINREM